MNWWQQILGYLASVDAPHGSARDLSRFDMGVCPGCRGLRAVASPTCQACGSVRAVTADA
jgi:hypothetical protein